MESRLSVSDGQRVLAVCEAAAKAPSLSEFLGASLGAIDEHLGFGSSAFMLVLAGQPDGDQRAYAGVDHGSPPYVIEEYFERWAALDPLASRPGAEAYRTCGCTSITELYSQLDPARRRFVDDFLRRIGAVNQLSFRLPGAWTDGYITVMGRDDFCEHDRRILAALVPELGALLRGYLPRGLNGALSRRESQVAELVAAGYSNVDVSRALQVEEDTVKKHVSTSLAKLGLQRRTQLAVAWATGRLLDPPAPGAGAERRPTASSL